MDKCNHHWHIESPDGPESKGTCKLCGVTKTFLNSEPGPRGPGKARAPSGLGLSPSAEGESGGKQKHLGFYVPSIMDWDRH